LSNAPSATFNVAFDASGQYNGYSPLPLIANAGLFRKTAGTGTATLTVAPVNSGVIEVDSGTLAVPGGFSLGTGALTVALGGIGAGHFGQLAVSGSVTLNGTLNVFLTNNFVPAISNQFQIVSCTSRSGTFASVNVPAGISVTYSDNGVFLVVTGPVPVQILYPQLVGTNFIFQFPTASNQSYTIQRNDDLTTTNWVFCTNIVGNGSAIQFQVPVTVTPLQRFFRIREP